MYYLYTCGCPAGYSNCPGGTQFANPYCKVCFEKLECGHGKCCPKDVELATVLIHLRTQNYLKFLTMYLPPGCLCYHALRVQYITYLKSFMLSFLNRPA